MNWDSEHLRYASAAPSAALAVQRTLDVVEVPKNRPEPELRTSARKRRLTASSDEWDEIDDLTEALYGVSAGVTGYVEDNGDQFVWWIERVEDGEWLVSGNAYSAEDAKVAVENELGVVASRSRGRRTASLWDQIREPRHKVAGWDWNDQLAGYIAQGGAADFACICGNNVAAPGYVTCACGKIWNASLHEGSDGIKLVCREVPNRGADIVLANRRPSA